MSGLQMDTDVIAEAGRRLRASGDRLADSWSQVRAAIGAYEGGIGTGRLADAFRRTYTPASAEALASAGAFPARIVDLGGATSLAAARYVATDDQAAERFRRLQQG